MNPTWFLILVSIVCGLACRALAARRGLDPVFWPVMGVALGPLALPFVPLTNFKKV